MIKKTILQQIPPNHHNNEDHVKSLESLKHKIYKILTGILKKIVQMEVILMVLSKILMIFEPIFFFRNLAGDHLARGTAHEIGDGVALGDLGQQSSGGIVEHGEGRGG